MLPSAWNKGFMQILRSYFSRIINDSSLVSRKSDVMICARTHDMENDYYVLAHQQASKERADLRAQIDTLLARDGKLEKLVDCLKEFIPGAELGEAAPEHQHAGSGNHSGDGHHHEG